MIFYNFLKIIISEISTFYSRLERTLWFKLICGQEVLDLGQFYPTLEKFELQTQKTSLIPSQKKGFLVLSIEKVPELGHSITLGRSRPSCSFLLGQTCHAALSSKQNMIPFSFKEVKIRRVKLNFAIKLRLGCCAVQDGVCFL